ncbi:hypothetical protein LUR56_39270 [Streptomyces sp. MT29]|nr:hypothetical protein [Streptomyces sp. MT29]
MRRRVRSRGQRWPDVCASSSPRGRGWYSKLVIVHMQEILGMGILKANEDHLPLEELPRVR